MCGMMVEIATGSGKDWSEELKYYCYRIVLCGNLLLHLSCPLYMPNDDNCFRSSINIYIIIHNNLLI